VWEHWGGNAHDYGGGSKNHPMFMGGLGVFLYDLAGLASTPDMDLATPDMAAGGGGSVVLAPGAGSRAAAELIGAASVSTVTPAGRVSFEWSYHAVPAAGAGAGAASAVVASANVTVPVGLALPVRLRLHPGQWGDGASGDTGCSLVLVDALAAAQGSNAEVCVAGCAATTNTASGKGAGIDGVAGATLQQGTQQGGGADDATHVEVLLRAGTYALVLQVKMAKNYNA
jgi:hypothetical protein